MRFDIDIHAITTRELIACESSLSGTVEVVSRFMLTDDGTPIPQAEAKEMLLDMPLDDQLEVQSQFLDSILPKVKGKRS